jgi:hypothetical protein
MKPSREFRLQKLTKAGLMEREFPERPVTGGYRLSAAGRGALLVEVGGPWLPQESAGGAR